MARVHAKKRTMPELKLKFQIDLTRSVFDPMDGKGPLFHRWLPDGKNDAIVLTIPGTQEQLRVWFERRMVVDHGHLRWKSDGVEFDPNIMQKQYKIAAGELFGDMNAAVSKAELAAVEKVPIKLGEEFGLYDPASPEYVEVGKRITSKIQEAVGKFVSRLRTQYGQYWLETLLPWDSRRMSLGSYCSSMLRLIWWSETSGNWCRFLPTPSSSTISAPAMPGRGFAEYLTEVDWRAIQARRCQSEVGLGLELLGAATEALDTGNWSYAFVTVATALELALIARVRDGQSDPRVTRALHSFNDHETLPARAAVVLLACEVPVDDVAAVLLAIETRNKIVHEGYRPNAPEASGLRPVMQTIRVLMQLDELKTPILTNSNCLGPAENA